MTSIPELIEKRRIGERMDRILLDQLLDVSRYPTPPTRDEFQAMRYARLNSTKEPVDA